MFSVFLKHISLESSKSTRCLFLIPFPEKDVPVMPSKLIYSIKKFFHPFFLLHMAHNICPMQQCAISTLNYHSSSITLHPFCIV